MLQKCTIQDDLVAGKTHQCCNLIFELQLAFPGWGVQEEGWVVVGGSRDCCLNAQGFRRAASSYCHPHIDIRKSPPLREQSYAITLVSLEANLKKDNGPVYVCVVPAFLGVRLTLCCTTVLDLVLPLCV